MYIFHVDMLRKKDLIKKVNKLSIYYILCAISKLHFKQEHLESVELRQGQILPALEM